MINTDNHNPKKKFCAILIKNKIKISIVFLLLFYLVMCPSCMTMRISSKETKTFFATSQTNYKDSTITIDAVPIHYIETGNPNFPTLIFVHGSPGSWDAFRDYLKDTLLLKKFRMIAVDRPGFGYSNYRKAENLGTQSQLIEKFADKIKNSNSLYLIGHSLGGPLIVKMATEKPNDYKGLVLLAGALDPKAEKPENWRLAFKAKPIRYFVPGALLPSNDELWWLKEDLVRMEPNLKKITTDVIIIHGTKDDLVPYSNVAFMKREFVNAKSISVTTIKDANHFIPWEHYQLIRDKLLELK